MLSLVVIMISTAQAEFKVGMDPGMAIRIEQGTMNAMKSALKDLLPKVAKHKVGLPSNFHYKVGLFVDWLSYHVNITDINYDDIELNVEDTHI